MHFWTMSGHPTIMSNAVLPCEAPALHQYMTKYRVSRAAGGGSKVGSEFPAEALVHRPYSFTGSTVTLIRYYLDGPLADHHLPHGSGIPVDYSEVLTLGVILPLSHLPTENTTK